MSAHVELGNLGPCDKVCAHHLQQSKNSASRDKGHQRYSKMDIGHLKATIACMQMQAPAVECNAMYRIVKNEEEFDLVRIRELVVRFK